MNVKRILTRALGLSEHASDDELAAAIADAMSPQTAPHGSQTATVGLLSAPDDPQATFHELAEQTSKVLGISLADGYNRVSQEAPTLYERATARARLN